MVFNTPGANANGVKELVLAGMLMASRDLIGGIEWCRANADDENIAKATEKSKKAFAGCEIKGKKLGVIGLGAIGAEVANAAAASGDGSLRLRPLHIGQRRLEAEPGCKAYHQRGQHFPGVRLYHHPCAAFRRPPEA